MCEGEGGKHYKHYEISTSLLREGLHFWQKIDQNKDIGICKWITWYFTIDQKSISGLQSAMADSLIKFIFCQLTPHVELTNIHVSVCMIAQEFFSRI